MNFNFIFISKLEVPFPEPSLTQMTLTHPREISNCTTKTIEIPRVECEDDDDEEFCYTTLTLEDADEVAVRSCEVDLGGGKRRCDDVTFEVPKTVCRSRPGPFFREH